MGQRHGHWILDGGGNGPALRCVLHRRPEFAAAEMEHVEQAPQSDAVEAIATGLGNGQALVQGLASQPALAVHIERRRPQAGLKMHLLGGTAGRVVEREKSPLRPAIAFGKQRHRQENRRSCSGKPDANCCVATGAEAPFQRRPDIVERGEMGGAFRPGRQARPCSPVLLKPAPVVSRMACGQVGELGVIDGDFEGVGARRVEQPVAHHRPDGAGRDHRLGHQAVHGAEHDRAIEGRARRHFQRRVEREVPDEDGEPAQHQPLEAREQPVAPIERGLQGLLTRRCRARPGPQQGEPLVEQGGRLLQAVGLDAPGGELDRQRHAVELAADAAHEGGVGIAQL
jgi:hypothetical protein